MKFRSALLGMTALFAAACSKESAAPSYGDPIGIRLDDDAKLPSLAVAVAATKGTDLTPAVNKLASAFHEASKSCPELTPLATTQTLRLKMSIEKGKLRAPANPSDEAVAVCILKSLEGKSVLPETTEKLDILAEFHMDLPRSP